MLKPRFVRAGGLNRSEQLLADLAERSFLSLWTYPNPFRKPGEELTDLLVVFGDDVLIFSDKAGAYPDTGDPFLDWSRYYGKAIAKSAHQINRAEGWLGRFPDQVFLDARCEHPLPVPLPPAGRIRVHRIAVVPAAAEAARARAGLAGLRIDTAVADAAEPFTVGRISECRGWVHVLDAESLAALLTEASTTPDLIRYLSAKETLMDRARVAAESERDLLAVYVWHGRTFADADEFRAEPGSWEALQADAGFRAGRDRDAVSMLWDRLIERMTRHFVGNDLQFGNEVAVADYERAARQMASEDRFHRRVLSNAILARAGRARAGTVASLLPSGDLDVVYVLLIVPWDGAESYEAYREARRNELLARCLAAKAARPGVQVFIGLGLDADNGRGGSEDLIYADTRDWGVAELARAHDLRDRLGFFGPQAAEERIAEQEFPR